MYAIHLAENNVVRICLKTCKLAAVLYYQRKKKYKFLDCNTMITRKHRKGKANLR